MKRWIPSLLFLLLGSLFIYLLIKEDAQTPLQRTFAPLFEHLGKTTKTADRMLSRVLPISDIDEKTLGDAFKSRYRRGRQSDKPSPYTPYLTSLVRELTADSQKPFTYEVFVLETKHPNAFALPGGVILFTTGLLEILTSEAQVVSILGHEVGHIERGHCFDSVRFQLLGEKFGGKTLGWIADHLLQSLTRSTYSKTQESEADDYGYQSLLAHKYYPGEMSEAFVNLKNSLRNQSYRNDVNPFRDYFDSHPPLELRIENFRERANRWRVRNPDEPAYVGTKNLQEKKPRSQVFYPEENIL